MLSVIRRHWGLVIAIGLSVLLAGMYLFGNFVDNYDAAGHRIMIDSMKTFWPSPIGWDNTTFLGHMYGEAYPMLMHWLMTGLSFIIGTDYSVKTFVIISLLLLPTSIYWYKGKDEKRSLGLLVVLLVMFALPGYVGSNFSGVFTYGLLPSFIVMPIFFTLLGTLNRIEHGFKFTVWSILLFSIIIWSHLVVAIAAGAFILAKLLGKNNSLVTKRLSIVIISGFILSLPLALAIVTGAGNTIQSSSGISTLLILNVALLSLSLILVWKLKLWNESTEARVAVVLLTFLCMVPVLTKISSFSLLHHAYRLQLFAYIFVGLFIVGVIKLDKTRTKILSYAFLTGFLVLSVYKIIGISENQVQVHIERNVSGVFIESFRRTESFPAPYAGQQQLVSGGGQWANGLFSESAPNAPFVQSVMKSLRPEAYPELGDGIDEVIKDPKDVTKMLSVFGISHIISLDENSNESMGSFENGSKKMYYHDKYLGEVSIAEALEPTTLVPVFSDWNKAVENWWRNDIDDYLYDASKGKIVSTQAAKKVTVIENSRNKIIIKIESDNPAPVLVKRTFSSRWKAADSDGKEIKIHKFSPFLMMVEGKGSITLSI